MPKTQRNRVIVWGIIGASIVILYLVQQVYVMIINDKLGVLEKNISQVQRENTVMEIALAKDTALEHIDTVAVHKLNMIRPEKVEYVVVSGLKK